MWQSLANKANGFAPPSYSGTGVDESKRRINVLNAYEDDSDDDDMPVRSSSYNNTDAISSSTEIEVRRSNKIEIVDDQRITKNKSRFVLANFWQEGNIKEVQNKFKRFVMDFEQVNKKWRMTLLFAHTGDDVHLGSTTGQLYLPYNKSEVKCDFLFDMIESEVCRSLDAHINMKKAQNSSDDSCGKLKSKYPMVVQLCVEGVRSSTKLKAGINMKGIDKEFLQTKPIMGDSKQSFNALLYDGMKDKEIYNAINRKMPDLACMLTVAEVPVMNAKDMANGKKMLVRNPTSSKHAGIMEKLPDTVLAQWGTLNAQHEFVNVALNSQLFVFLMYSIFQLLTEYEEFQKSKGLKTDDDVLPKGLSRQQVNRIMLMRPKKNDHKDADINIYDPNFKCDPLFLGNLVKELKPKSNSSVLWLISPSERRFSFPYAFISLAQFYLTNLMGKITVRNEVFALTAEHVDPNKKASPQDVIEFELFAAVLYPVMYYFFEEIV